MVRNYKRKTTRADIVETDVLKAVKEVIQNKTSVRQAAEMFSLTKSMLHKRVMKERAKKLHTENTSDMDSGAEVAEEEPVKRKFKSQRVFSDLEEGEIVAYLLKAVDINFGLTYRIARKMAYDYAKKLGKKHPVSWDENSSAGIDWMQGFMKRHCQLSLRKPENTSMARACAFNPSNVGVFYDNFNQIMEKYKFPPHRIINIDETGISTVLESPKVIASKGKKQVGATTSQERGELVTMCGIVSAAGISYPPVFIFPRVNFKERFLDGAPTGSIGFCQRTGWMTSEIFPKVLEHIQKHASSSPQNPVLVLMDNHRSHVCLEAITFAKENGIVLLSFPPHCSHKMQPLDVAVYGPFKSYMKTAIHDWQRNHPGRALQIADLPQLAAQPYQLAFSQKNIASGFAKPGIFPLNRLAFEGPDYLPSAVTDVHLPAALPSTEVTVAATPSAVASASNDPPLGTPDRPTSSIPKVITPELVLPLPKVVEKKTSNREKVKSTIYTSTPEKNKIEAKEMNKKRPKQTKRRLFEAKKTKTTADSSDDSEEDSVAMELLSEDEGVDEEDNDIFQDKSLEVDDYVLIQFNAKKKKIYYAGKILQIDTENCEAQVNFLRKKMNNFHFPLIEDQAPVDIRDIVGVLPQPKDSTTARQGKIFRFDFDFNKYNVL